MADEILTPRDKSLNIIENLKNNYYFNKSLFFEVFNTMKSRNMGINLYDVFFDFRGSVLSLIDRIKHNLPYTKEKEKMEKIYKYFLLRLNSDNIDLEEIYKKLDEMESIMTKYIDRLIPKKMRVF